MKDFDLELGKKSNISVKNFDTINEINGIIESK